MALKTYKPTTPSRRYITTNDFSILTKKSEQKKRPARLTQAKKSISGRNSHGHITVWQRGGGHKRKYRVIDFKRDNLNIPGTVASLEYDPNRSAFIALVFYKNGDKRYIIAPQQLKVGDTVIASDQADIFVGNHLSLAAIPVGTFIHNLEIEPGRGSTIVRSAGTYAQIVGRDDMYSIVRLPSGELRKIHQRCKATIGQVSNPEHENVTIGKAGRSRWLGKKPRVRGVAMNPVDHPMGGGEGRASGGHPRSAWGQYAKGLKTRRIKRTGVFIVKRRK